MEGNRIEILILGDGNFSFTYSLANALFKIPNAINNNIKYANNFRIIATIYDSEKDLASKYPESSKYLKELSNNKNITLLYDINATLDLNKQLNDKLHNSNNFGDEVNRLYKFDHIIFNFPHLGVESFELHKILIGHFIHQSKKILKNENSKIYLTLTQFQSEKWMLFEMINLNKCFIFNRYKFHEENFQFYNMKRHQNGKSFKSKVSSVICFVIKQNDNKNNKNIISKDNDDFDSNSYKNHLLEYPVDKDIFIEIIEIYKLHKSNQNHILYEEEISNHNKIDEVQKNLENTNINNTHNNSQPNKLNKPKKKRKMNDTTEDKISTIKDANGNEADQYQCKECNKIFTSLRGVQTHIYMIHIMQTAEISQNTSSTDKTPFKCQACNREFNSGVDLDQHIKSKHGSEYEISKNNLKDPNLNFYQEKIKGINLNNIDLVTEIGEVACEMCGLCFRDLEALETHKESLKPTEPTFFHCEKCNKKILDERGKNQHMNFCKN